jgi:hypothetical protein
MHNDSMQVWIGSGQVWHFNASVRSRKSGLGEQVRMCQHVLRGYRNMGVGVTMRTGGGVGITGCHFNAGWDQDNEMDLEQGEAISNVRT